MISFGFYRTLIFCLRSWSIAWYLLAVCFMISIIKQTNQYDRKWIYTVCSLIILLMLRLSLYLRPHNILVPAVLVYTCKFIKLENWDTLTTTILYYWLSLIFFFYQVSHNTITKINNLIIIIKHN